MINVSLVPILCMVRMHVHLHLRLPGCGHVSSTTETLLDLSLGIPGWVSAPAGMPAVHHATEAQGRRYQEVLASLPAGLKEPPAHLSLASYLQACSCYVCNACALYVCTACAKFGLARAAAQRAAHRVAMQRTA